MAASGAAAALGVMAGRELVNCGVDNVGVVYMRSRAAAHVN